MRAYACGSPKPEAGRKVKNAERTRLSQMESVSAAIVRTAKPFVDSSKTLLSSMKAFLGQCSVCFINGMAENTVKSTVASEYLPKSSHETLN